jgi:hypothetical protein
MDEIVAAGLFLLETGARLKQNEAARNALAQENAALKEKVAELEAAIEAAKPKDAAPVPEG